MTNFHTKFNLPIMVTEFACTVRLMLRFSVFCSGCLEFYKRKFQLQDFSYKVNPTAAQVRQWMADVINWMESTSWIIAYFAFGSYFHFCDGYRAASYISHSI